MHLALFSSMKGVCFKFHYNFHYSGEGASMLRRHNSKHWSELRVLKNLDMYWKIRHHWFQLVPISFSLTHTVFIIGLELQQCTLLYRKNIYKVSYYCIICEDWSLHVIYFSYLTKKYLPLILHRTLWVAFSTRSRYLSLFITTHTACKLCKP